MSAAAPPEKSKGQVKKPSGTAPPSTKTVASDLKPKIHLEDLPKDMTIEEKKQKALDEIKKAKVAKEAKRLADEAQFKKEAEARKTYKVDSKPTPAVPGSKGAMAKKKNK